jgi:hypothetical protein
MASKLPYYEFDWLAVIERFSTRAEPLVWAASPYKLQVRKLVAIQSCQEGNRLTPRHLKISTEKSHCQCKTKQYNVIKVTILT